MLDSAQPTLRHDPVAATPLSLSNSKGRAAWDVKHAPLPAQVDTNMSAALQPQPTCNASRPRVPAPPAAIDKKAPPTLGGPVTRNGGAARGVHDDRGRGSAGDLTTYLPHPLSDAGLGGGGGGGFFGEGAGGAETWAGDGKSSQSSKWQFKLGSILEQPSSMPPPGSLAASQSAPFQAAAVASAEPLPPHGRRSDAEKGKDREKERDREKAGDREEGT